MCAISALHYIIIDEFFLVGRCTNTEMLVDEKAQSRMKVPSVRYSLVWLAID